ncbi:hypothetical protein CCYA_CCYA01G0009 [Cyanidiococcus yangmingshanensis]|nr:hypothetical protein CCYA_CCYA01G0009 [Cyanidiococcus yangmingshanensis]
MRGREDQRRVQGEPEPDGHWARLDLESGPANAPPAQSSSNVSSREGAALQETEQPSTRVEAVPTASGVAAEEEQPPGRSFFPAYASRDWTINGRAGYSIGADTERMNERSQSELSGAMGQPVQSGNTTTIPDANASLDHGRPRNADNSRKSEENCKHRSSNSASVPARVESRPNAEKTPNTTATPTAASSASPAETFHLQQLLQYHASRNVGSRARDLLALERTFLSMIRTSLASVTLGVAIAKLIGTRLADATGTVFISLGLLTLVIGLWRYYSQILAIERGQFAADTVFPWVVVFLLLTSGIISLVLIFK